MKFWERKSSYSVCKECGVHFEPANASESRWGDLCKTHRKPIMERDYRRDRVIAWATQNWEKLAEQEEKETAEKAAGLAASYSYQKNDANLYSLQQNQMVQRLSPMSVDDPYCGLGNIFGSSRQGNQS